MSDEIVNDNNCNKHAFDNLEWSDIVVNGNNLIIKGLTDKELHAKDLCKACSILKIKGVKNVPKNEMVRRLMETHQLRQQLELVKDSKGNKTRKESQCTFRLVNVLFSDGFAGQFAMLGNMVQWNI